jgi:hypothetical protein
MWSWLNANSGAVQGLAALGTLFLTEVLAGITFWYARLTRSALAISKEQFDRHWRPQLGISLEYVAQYKANLTIRNISNCSVVITGVLLRVSDDSRPAVSYLVNQPVDAHSKEVVDIAGFVVDAIRSHSHMDNDHRKLLVGVDYEALGFIGRIAFLEYAVRISQAQVAEIAALDVVPKLR